MPFHLSSILNNLLQTLGPTILSRISGRFPPSFNLISTRSVPLLPSIEAVDALIVIFKTSFAIQHRVSSIFVFHGLRATFFFPTVACHVLLICVDFLFYISFYLHMYVLSINFLMYSNLQVYLTLGCALVASAAGAYLHILWNIGGILTALAGIGCITWLMATPPYEEVSFFNFSFLLTDVICMRIVCPCSVCLFYVFNIDVFALCLVIRHQRKRLSMLMAAALLEGASIGPLIGLAIEIDPRYVVSLCFFFGLFFVLEMYSCYSAFCLVVVTL